MAFSKLAIPARYQTGTARIGTGALRLIRHSCCLLPDKKKAPGEIFPPETDAGGQKFKEVWGSGFR